MAPHRFGCAHCAQPRAGVEFVVDQDGSPYTYDINTNTNYNSEAESRAGCSGMGAIAEYLGQELAEVGKLAS